MSTTTATSLTMVELPVSLTEKAAQQVRLIQERESRANSFLRVSVVGGGCSGLSYKLSFEDAPKEKDKVGSCFGVSILVDPKSFFIFKRH